MGINDGVGRSLRHEPFTTLEITNSMGEDEAVACTNSLNNAAN
jgi:hypothetical protein